MEKKMTDTLGLTHAIISRSADPEDPHVFHVHGIREGGESVLVATVDDEKPFMASRILRMMQGRGLTIEGIDLVIDIDEPDVVFVGMRDSIDGAGKEWVDLETRFVDGEKTAAATFAAEFEAFAEEMVRIWPRPEARNGGPGVDAVAYHVVHAPEQNEGAIDFLDVAIVGTASSDVDAIRMVGEHHAASSETRELWFLRGAGRDGDEIHAGHGHGLRSRTSYRIVATKDGRAR
jgi:hypothetical protein